MFDDIKDSLQSISNKEDNKGENLGENKEFASPAAPKDSIPTSSLAPESAPPTQAGEIDDIFAETEEKEKPEVLKPKVFEEESDADARDKNAGEREAKGKKIFVLAIIIIGGLLVGSGGYLGYNRLMSKFNNDIEAGVLSPEQIDNEDSIIEDSPEINIDNNSQGNAVQGEPFIDSDRDGLSDEEERALGTDINNVDTDGDGLFDREEVKVYKTNPLLRDTDGDGFLDGAEVKKGYDPNGPGKLYEIK